MFTAGVAVWYREWNMCHFDRAEAQREQQVARQAEYEERANQLAIRNSRR